MSLKDHGMVEQDTQLRKPRPWKSGSVKPKLDLNFRCSSYNVVPGSFRICSKICTQIEFKNGKMNRIIYVVLAKRKDRDKVSAAMLTIKKTKEFSRDSPVLDGQLDES